jgi:hypothetical protein
MITVDGTPTKTNSSSVAYQELIKGIPQFSNYKFFKYLQSCSLIIGVSANITEFVYKFILIENLPLQKIFHRMLDNQCSTALV